MVDGSSHIMSNHANSVKEFFKNALAPYGTTMVFVEILPGVIINTANIVDIQEVVEVEESVDFAEVERNLKAEYIEATKVTDVESEDIKSEKV